MISDATATEEDFVKLIRLIGRIFYDDLSNVVLHYLLRKKVAFEQQMARELNLPDKVIRQSLKLLEKHNILYSKDISRKHLNKEERDILESTENKISSVAKGVKWSFDRKIQDGIKYRFKMLNERINERKDEEVMICKKCNNQNNLVNTISAGHFECKFCGSTDLVSKDQELIEQTKRYRGTSYEILSKLKELIIKTEGLKLSDEFLGLSESERGDYRQRISDYVGQADKERGFKVKVQLQFKNAILTEQQIYEALAQQILPTPH